MWNYVFHPTSFLRNQLMRFPIGSPQSAREAGGQCWQPYRILNKTQCNTLSFHV